MNCRVQFKKTTKRFRRIVRKNLFTKQMHFSLFEKQARCVTNQFYLMKLTCWNDIPLETLTDIF